MKKVIGSIFVYFLWVNVFAQHMPLTTQYMYHGLLVNPAVTGTRNDLVTSLSYRSQWLGGKFAPNTILLSAHAPLKNNKIALGLQIYRDNLGFVQKTGLGSYAAYRIINGAKMLSFGLKIGVYQTSINYEDINLITENDPSFSGGSKSFKPGVGAGVYYKTPQFYLGIAVPEIVNKIEEDLMSGTVNLNVIGGYSFVLSDHLKLIPNLQLRTVLDNNVQSDLTVFMRINKVFDIGLIYRSLDMAGISLSYIIDHRLQIAYSFDTSLNTMNTSSSYGSHEINISFEFKKIVKTLNTKFF